MSIPPPKVPLAKTTFELEDRAKAMQINILFS